MRLTIAALPLLALAAPLSAAAADREVAGAVATLNDPATQERMADTVTALVGALMQMKVGPLADAVARIDPETAAAVDRYKRARGRHKLGNLPDLWLNRFGPMGISGAQAMIGRRCEQAGVPKMHWHQLRHRFAHRWLSQGGQEGDLARLGGWSDPAVMRRYGSALATERALDAYDELGGVL